MKRGDCKRSKIYSFGLTDKKDIVVYRELYFTKVWYLSRRKCQKICYYSFKHTDATQIAGPHDLIVQNKSSDPNPLKIEKAIDHLDPEIQNIKYLTDFTALFVSGSSKIFLALKGTSARLTIIW